LLAVTIVLTLSARIATVLLWAWIPILLTFISYWTCGTTDSGSYIDLHL
jgi:hypothetical protein